MGTWGPGGVSLYLLLYLLCVVCGLLGNWAAGMTAGGSAGVSAAVSYPHHPSGYQGLEFLGRQVARQLRYL